MKFTFVISLLLCSPLLAAPPPQMSMPTVLGPNAFCDGDVVEITDVRATSPKSKSKWRMTLLAAHFLLRGASRHVAANFC
jgi:hypothetical protein